ncbi:hypothetical protein GCM10027168_05000 [Streptomyces capparidis]
MHVTSLIRRRPLRIPIVLAASAALLAALPAVSSAEGTAAGDTPKATGPSGAADAPPPEAVPRRDRAAVLGPGHATSDDVAWTTSGDAAGFHVLVADAKDGYGWRTAASLSEPGFDTDAWIGNACVTESGRRAVVAYAPRTFTNKPHLMTRGAFTAVVDLGTGEVIKLPVQATLAHFSPGCGAGEQAVLSQFTDDASGENATRLVTVDARAGAAGKPLKLRGQVTSAVPVGGGAFAAADGARLVRIGPKGERKAIARTDGIPFRITRDASGGLTYLDPVRHGRGAAATGEVEHVPAAAVARPDAGRAAPRVLASGGLTGLDLAGSASGEVFVTGEAKTRGKLPAHVHNPGSLAKDARITTRGLAAVASRWAEGEDTPVRPEQALTERTVTAVVEVPATGRTVELRAEPGATPVSADGLGQGRETSPALTAPGRADGGRASRSAAADPSPTNPVEAERTCAVPRGDITKQAFQPTPRQIEWAVDQAVINGLNKWIYRGPNWKGTDIGAYRPQELFPLRVLAGDPNGTVDRDDQWHIPAQVLLGITAQESNMWQATRYAVPGETSNALIGNYYGVSYSSEGNQGDPWSINWADADCGYGVTQVTDGMRLPGKGQPTLPTIKQEAVALDYTANIAAGADILAEKWNQTRGGGLIVNDGHPRYLENWFFALWAYNSGFYPESQAGEHNGKWGVGFTNNPANPLWKANRTPFLESANGGDDYSHAAHPQDWPYQEKVLGWAARPVSALFAPGDMQAGYRQAWWNSPLYRTAVKPSESLFCDSSNECDPSLIGDHDANEPGKGACTREDLHCWWNKKVAWKDCVKAAACGNPIHRFNNADYPEQPDGNPYPPRCTSGLPSGTLVVDDVPNGVRPAGSDARACTSLTSSGTFGFTFAYHNGKYPGKMDLHQIGAGYGNHFWFSHTRSVDPHLPPDDNGNRLRTTGTWTLNRSLGGWARVWVHMPDHGAHTRQAAYTVHGTDSTSPVRVHPQRVKENRWVDLGVFRFTGTPKVSLTTHADDGDGSEDVAWDAVGFQPLSAKPRNFVVAMGDSYSSGEGASVKGGGDYYKETDLDGTDSKWRNACHRSRHAWSRQATLPGYSTSIGAMADNRDPALDYHLIACSGAQTENILGADGPANTWGEKGRPAFRELPQLDQGYLDQNTTLVTLSVGGNDARFGDIIKQCIIGMSGACQGNVLGDDGEPLRDAEPKLIRDRVRPSIVTVLEQIRAKAPNAKIVLMGYPQLFSREEGDCLPTVGGEEEAWLNDTADVLATEMAGAAADARARGVQVWFADPRAAFAGKAVCGDPETVHGFVADLTPGDDPQIDWGPLEVGSAQSFHPKIEGARLYAGVLNSTFGEMGM